jgi:hypothetical protein
VNAMLADEKLKRFRAAMANDPAFARKVKAQQELERANKPKKVKPVKAAPAAPTAPKYGILGSS